MTVAVVGAGIGGLTAALALARQGIPVRLFEQAERLAEVGAGLTVPPNAGRVLDHLGLGAALRALGVRPGTQHIRDLATGATIRTLARDADLEERHGAPYRHLHRADLHGLLVEALARAAPGALQLGHRLVDVTPDGRMTFADGTHAGADLVVGADGVRSVVRQRLFAAEPPQFTGQVAWRGLVPTARLPAAVAAEPPGIWVGTGRLVLRYPLRGGVVQNYAVFVATDAWREESWSIPSDADELLAHLGDACPAVRALIEATPQGALFKWALFAREPLSGWVVGRVTLLGDAAHPMLPFLGQGAATAIEDAMVLARALAAHPMDRALALYERACRPHSALVQRHARLLGRTFQGEDPAALRRGPLRNEEELGLFDRDVVRVPLERLASAAGGLQAAEQDVG
ncbi:MAG: FAD-dependent monooxygenase [Sphingomonadaceae bacterium]|uniref:FAD-dependent monooxygenase n=1 Tax=Thermaurantiacus sp. TaxID=2820283 RepID=UPI00298F0B33|nr:FAD-dependent monooxygenase [Thermaurantiacus sp.]MCS6987565.1 FAD-dependent monooxygenase [Sphingomonadaceae bacterium]MDW8415166.1 FAD-dependent monooxygenase [Thermaurantiacus sp.]